MLLAVGAGVFRYVDRHFHNSEIFVENSAELADDVEIREHIFAGLRAELIMLAERDPAIDDGVGDDASTGDLGDLFGTGEPDPTPVTDEIIARDQGIEEVLLNALDSDLYQVAFTDSLRQAQIGIVDTASISDVERLRNSGGVSFDMRRLYPGIYAALAENPATAEITTVEVPSQFGLFTVADRETTFDAVWNTIDRAPRWRTLTLVGTVFSLIAAVVITDRRPSTIMQYGAGLLGGGLLITVVVFIVRALVPLLVGSGPSGPVVSVYRVTTWPLITAMLWLAFIGAVFGVAGYVARLIWPDEWVIDHVHDHGGVRSIKRRRGTPAVDQPQVAAAQTPGPYAAYPPGYGHPGQWGSPYQPQHYPPQHYPQPGYAPPQPLPGQQYAPPPGYGQTVGPFAEPGSPGQFEPGRPTVPVMPVSDERTEATASVRPATRVDSDGLPADAARAVPRVVASVDGSANADDRAEQTAGTTSAPLGDDESE